MHRSRNLLILPWLIIFINLHLVFPVNGAYTVVQTGSMPIQAKAAILMDASSGRILYEMNPHQRVSPASVTKIMTALLVVEAGDLNQMVTVSEKAAATPESAVWLEAGEKLTREQLLYALMLNSANDSSVALAESIAGTEEDFVERMNRRAWELGLEDTHFRNPHGLETDGHYSSAYDLALVSREGMKHEMFRQVVASKTKVIPWIGKDFERQLINKNRLLWRYDDAIGIKTGYTKVAGNCVVGAAQRGSLTLIAVALNSPCVYDDLKNMLDHGFDNYSMQTIEKSDQLSIEIPIANGQTDTFQARPEADLSVALTTHEKDQASYRVFPEEQIAAPVNEGQVVGTCKVFVADNEVSTFDLLASIAVEEKPPLLSRVKSGVITTATLGLKVLLIIFCCLYMIRIINLRRQRKRRKYRF
ncbi:MAG: D-alanyl-D-alanine carboxypeptidase [Syntrophomonadaceae bacterium]|nr:D-alanyl-D-alanine carboxypeptidase [Syntrophomonadaceae bacterium]